MPIEAYTEAIEDARVAAERDFGLVLRWIYDIPGETGLPGRRRHPRLRAQPPRRTRWSASGSAARRSAYRARSSSRTSTPPAPRGCTASRTPARPPGPETVWDALRLLGAERIGHGTSVGPGPRAARAPAAEGIPLEVCPSSNIATRAVATLERAPDRRVPRRRRDGHGQLRRPADVRDHAEPGVRDRRRPARTSTRRGVAELARAAVRASFAPDEA